jgi:membrane associated rhomboid family serine protease
MSNYFSPSHSPFSQFKATGLTRSRFYSSFRNGGSQEASNTRVLYSLIGINVAVFGYAMYTKAQAQSGFSKPYITFMRNMSCNLTEVLQNGRWWTMLTSTFTHVEIWHLAGNMFTAYFLGTFLCASPIITPVRFLTIALGAGFTGSVGYVYQRYLVTHGQGKDYKRGLGFSGALMGITSVAACLNPTSKVLIYGIVPMPLWGLVLGYAFYDGYYLNDGNSRIGHAGHLGGLAFGIAYYVLKLRGLRV